MYLSSLFVSICIVFHVAFSSRLSPFQVLAGACIVATKEIVITVGGNTTGDGSTTFDPRSVIAELDDVVIFNCRFHSCS